MTDKTKGILIGAIIGLVVGVGGYWLLQNAGVASTAVVKPGTSAIESIRAKVEARKRETSTCGATCQQNLDFCEHEYEIGVYSNAAAEACIDHALQS